MTDLGSGPLALDGEDALNTFKGKNNP